MENARYANLPSTIWAFLDYVAGHVKRLWQRSCRQLAQATTKVNSIAIVFKSLHKESALYFQNNRSKCPVCSRLASPALAPRHRLTFLAMSHREPRLHTLSNVMTLLTSLYSPRKSVIKPYRRHALHRLVQSVPCRALHLQEVAQPLRQDEGHGPRQSLPWQRIEKNPSVLSAKDGASLPLSAWPFSTLHTARQLLSSSAITHPT